MRSDVRVCMCGCVFVFECVCACVCMCGVYVSERAWDNAECLWLSGSTSMIVPVSPLYKMKVWICVRGSVCLLWRVCMWEFVGVYEWVCEFVCESVLLWNAHMSMCLWACVCVWEVCACVVCKWEWDCLCHVRMCAVVRECGCVSLRRGIYVTVMCWCVYVVCMWECECETMLGGLYVTITIEW